MRWKARERILSICLVLPGIEKVHQVSIQKICSCPGNKDWTKSTGWGLANDSKNLTFPRITWNLRRRLKNIERQAALMITVLFSHVANFRDIDGTYRITTNLYKYRKTQRLSRVRCRCGSRRTASWRHRYFVIWHYLVVVQGASRSFHLR